MKTNIDIIKKMGELGILKTETVTDKKIDDITFVNDMDIEKKVILDGVSEDDLPMLIALKQYEMTKKIKSMVTFLVALGIGAVAAVVMVLIKFFLY